MLPNVLPSPSSDAHVPVLAGEVAAPRRAPGRADRRLHLRRGRSFPLACARARGQWRAVAIDRDPTTQPYVDALRATKDPRYFTTYYAIDTVNFKPVNLSSALDTIEGSHLPLIVQESAGLPLDPSFVEQKRILERCNGMFYACAGGAEARRFNRLLIDAGLIKGL